MPDPLHLVFLPATDPGDATFGAPPRALPGRPEAVLHAVRFPRIVWYNAAVRAEAIAQIRALGAGPFVLVGFSKSALGAWNIARAIPHSVAATILFDGPVARPDLPPWGTAPFYSGDAAWRADLPLHSVAEFHDNLPAAHRLVLVSGELFHDEMQALSEALARAGRAHVFLPRPRLRHHWNSGWLEEALDALPGPAAPVRHHTGPDAPG